MRFLFILVYFQVLSKTTQVDQKLVFSKIGKYASSTSEAHVRYHIKLGMTFEALEASERHLRKLETTAFNIINEVCKINLPYPLLKNGFPKWPLQLLITGKQCRRSRTLDLPLPFWRGLGRGDRI